MSEIKVRRRTDGKVERWQVDFYALSPGALRAERRRYTAPRSITSKSGAVRWAEHARREIEAGRPVPQSREARAAAPRSKASKPAPEALTLREGVDIYLADLAGRGAAASTVRVQRRNLGPFVDACGDRPLADVGEAEASEVRAAMLAAGYAPGTVNAAATVFGIALRRLAVLKRRGPVESKIERVKGRRTRTSKAYDDATFEALLAAAAGDATTRAVLLLTGEAGLRVGEVIGLDVDDVDPQRRELCVRRSVSQHGEVTPPKTGEERVVPMTARLAAVLGDVIADRVAGPLLPGSSFGGRASRSGIRHRLTSVQAAVGLQPKGPHALRHTAATSALAAGADVAAVQRLLGHARASTTVDMYLHDTGGAAARATAAIERGRANAAPVTDLSRAPRTAPKRKTRTGKKP